MIQHERDNKMAENDINNEEQYKEAADRLIKYYDENRDKLKINVANNDLYKNFYEKYNLDILSSLTPKQFMKEILFNKGNDDNKDLCHQLEFGLYKSCGLISNPGGVYRYYIHNTNNGWIVGYKGKTARKVSFEEAKNIAINLKEKILKGEFKYTENKLLEINFQNSRCTYDTNKNQYVNKKKSRGKVDMVISLINAIYLLQQDVFLNQMDFTIQIV